MSCRTCTGSHLCATCQALLDRSQGHTRVALSQADMQESALRATLLEVSRPASWLHYHTQDSRGSKPGFPDDVWIRPYDALILAELKDRYRKPTQEQLTWLSVLQTVTHVEAYLWRPGDLETATARFTQSRRRPHDPRPGQ